MLSFGRGWAIELLLSRVHAAMVGKRAEADNGSSAPATNGALARKPPVMGPKGKRITARQSYDVEVNAALVKVEGAESSGVDVKEVSLVKV